MQSTGAEAAATEVTPVLTFCAHVLSSALLRVPGLALPMPLIPPNKRRMANLGREHSSASLCPPQGTATTTLTAIPGLRVPPTPLEEVLHLCLPSVEEKREPEAVKLVRDFWI